MSEPLDEGRQRARRWAIIVTAGVAVAVAGALVGSAVLTSPTAGPTATPSADQDLQVVEYERPSAAGEDPFTTAADVEGEDVIRFTPASGSAEDPNEPFGG